MSEKKAGVTRRVHIMLCIREKVMVPVLGSPPQHALLGRALGKTGKNQLKPTACGVGTVREVAVVASSDPEHPQPIERHAQRDSLPRYTSPNGSEAYQMNEDERDCLRVNDVVVVMAVVRRLGRCRRTHSEPKA
jgi:hypothetical protein